MAIFKCKMCGGDLLVDDDRHIAECEFCGTKQTLPSVRDENIQSLFNRANVLRMKSEFDKAEDIYEKILSVNESEAEAYWGLILCKYGIEYVDDPISLKKIPTCHRVSYDAVVSDEDYKNALRYAENDQRELYEAEAIRFDEIQKEILEISKREEPYDVFICYKEVDSNGNRTQDSVIANDIYYQLNQDKIRTFYAAISLEDKLGKEYEPYIFSALTSAKVMLVLGTRPEYFSAPWVKNEWSRYMKLMKTDKKKSLFPCYRDMDAYELPEEFAHLQAQDMSKIGFINDLIRGIKKILDHDVKNKTSSSDGKQSYEPLLKRAFLSVEDEEWERADDFAEQVLNQDPENAQAYFAKLLVEYRVRDKKALSMIDEILDASNNFMKAYRYGDEREKAELNEIKHSTYENYYQESIQMLNGSTVEDDYVKVAKRFERIKEYKDAEIKHRECLDLIDQIRKVKREIKEIADKREHLGECDITGTIIGSIILTILCVVFLVQSLGTVDQKLGIVIAIVFGLIDIFMITKSIKRYKNAKIATALDREIKEKRNELISVLNGDKNVQ